VTRLAVLACAAALAACRREPAPLPQVRAAILRPSDTLQFEAPARAYRCDGSSDLMIEAVQSNHGVLVWLRLVDTVPSVLPIIGARDTITRPAAVVTARFAHQAVPHTLGLDSGAVTVSDSAGRRVTVAGSGLDAAFAVRAGLRATFDPLPAAPESTRACRPAA
jgi:hypothetical protein